MEATTTTCLSKKTMKAAWCDGSGTSSIVIKKDVAIPEPSKREVLIEVHASGLNRIDTYMSKGAFGPIRTLGMEVSGVVVGVGDEASLKTGTRVMALLSDGGHAQFVNVDERHVIPIPNDMSFETAAAIPEQWLTAYQLLRLVGEMKRGDRVLVHAGGSGVGTAAVQLAVAFGASAVFVTAGTTEKINNAMKLGANGGFNYKTQDWGEGVLKATEGRGVDVILDCVGGSHAPNNIKSLATDSRWVLFGLMGGRDAPGVGAGLLGQLLRKRASIRGTTLRTRSHTYKDTLTTRFASEALPLLANNKVKVIIDSVFSLDRVVDAYDRLLANKNIGKIVINKISD